MRETKQPTIISIANDSSLKSPQILSVQQGKLLCTLRSTSCQLNMLSRTYLTVEFTSYYNTKRSHMERDHLPPIREEPDEVATISIDQIEVRKYVGGLIKSFERKVA